MKSIMTAIALVIAAPAAAQGAPAHQDHGRHQQGQGQGHDQHGQHQQGQHQDHRDCCEDRNGNGRMDCCDEAENGRRAACCEEEAARQGGDHAH